MSSLKILAHFPVALAQSGKIIKIILFRKERKKEKKK